MMPCRYEDILHDFEQTMKSIARHLTLTERFPEEEIMKVGLALLGTSVAGIDVL